VHADLEMGFQLPVEVEVEASVDVPARIRRTQGFVVETDSGHFGTVEDFRVGDRAGARGFLVVRAGWRGRRRMMINVDDVAHVLPREGVVRLRSRWMAMRV
jgi:hypothetical protein